MSKLRHHQSARHAYFRKPMPCKGGDLITQILAHQLIKCQIPIVKQRDAERLFGLADGGAAARLLRSRLYQVKRRFRHVLNSFLDSDFFGRTEAQHDYGQLKHENIGNRLGAAYDLRSKYVHSGESYGRWIAPERTNDEVQIGHPVVADAAFARALHMAPTFIGLERIMRYCLLRFAEKHFGVDLAVEEPSEAG
ncbi:hypothetical protein ACFSOZ_23310 [Mesorhizobium newzealandense]|uniref:Apea-like HEPN domain-containing protein n=1 Tax=Mesorhizobium newzealandense TaxID=1300302 RepID=A0ABW4UH35_9HYPH